MDFRQDCDPYTDAAGAPLGSPCAFSYACLKALLWLEYGVVLHPFFPNGAASRKPPEGGLSSMRYFSNAATGFMSSAFTRAGMYVVRCFHAWTFLSFETTTLM